MWSVGDGLITSSQEENQSRTRQAAVVSSNYFDRQANTELQQWEVQQHAEHDSVVNTACMNTVRSEEGTWWHENSMSDVIDAALCVEISKQESKDQMSN